MTIIQKGEPMSDLISRADAISVLDNFTQTDTLGHTPRQIVEALPSAQSTIEPRAKGEWIANKYGAVICSKCNWPAPMIMTGCLVNRHLEYDKSDFCWHCGADMREVTE